MYIKVIYSVSLCITTIHRKRKQKHNASDLARTCIFPTATSDEELLNEWKQECLSVISSQSINIAFPSMLFRKQVVDWFNVYMHM